MDCVSVVEMMYELFASRKATAMGQSITGGATWHPAMSSGTRRLSRVAAPGELIRCFDACRAHVCPANLASVAAACSMCPRPRGSRFGLDPPSRYAVSMNAVFRGAPSKTSRVQDVRENANGRVIIYCCRTRENPRRRTSNLYPPHQSGIFRHSFIRYTGG